MRTVTNPEIFRSNISDKIRKEGKLRSTVARNIEIGIYNYALEEADSRNTVALGQPTFCDVI